MKTCGRRESDQSCTSLQAGRFTTGLCHQHWTKSAHSGTGLWQSGHAGFPCLSSPPACALSPLLCHPLTLPLCTPIPPNLGFHPRSGLHSCISQGLSNTLLVYFMWVSMCVSTLNSASQNITITTSSHFLPVPFVDL